MQIVISEYMDRNIILFGSDENTNIILSILYLIRVCNGEFSPCIRFDINSVNMELVYIREASGVLYRGNNPHTHELFLCSSHSLSWLDRLNYFNHIRNMEQSMERYIALKGKRL